MKETKLQDQKKKEQKTANCCLTEMLQDEINHKKRENVKLRERQTLFPPILKAKISLFLGSVPKKVNPSRND